MSHKRKRPPHLADRDYEPSPLNRPFIESGMPKPQRSRVAIYAFGLGKNEAPLDDDGWDVWALNVIPPIDSAGRLRADLWFEIHEKHAQSADDMRWIRKCPVPMVVPPCLEDYTPCPVTIPMDRMMLRFGLNAPYACTFAYQIAMALLVGYETIGLFGVELAYGSPRERTVEWACVNWWIGFAEAKGVEIVRPRGMRVGPSRLGQHPHFYGLDYDAEIEDTERYISLIGEGKETRLDG